MLVMVDFEAEGVKIYMHSSLVVLGNFLYFFKVFCEQLSWVSSGVCREGGGKG